MDRGFGDNVGVQTVAEVNRVDVVTTVPHESASMSFPSLMCFPTESFHSARFGRDPFFFSRFQSPTHDPETSHSPFQITIHNSKEHLEEQVDGIDQHRQQIEPRFARHGVTGQSFGLRSCSAGKEQKSAKFGEKSPGGREEREREKKEEERSCWQ